MGECDHLGGEVEWELRVILGFLSYIEHGLQTGERETVKSEPMLRSLIYSVNSVPHHHKMGVVCTE